MRFVKEIVTLLPGLGSVTVHCGLEKGEGRDMHGARTMDVDKTGSCRPKEVAARGLIWNRNGVRAAEGSAPQGAPRLRSGRVRTRSLVLGHSEGSALARMLDLSYDEKGDAHTGCGSTREGGLTMRLW